MSRFKENDRIRSKLGNKVPGRVVRVTDRGVECIYCGQGFRGYMIVTESEDDIEHESSGPSRTVTRREIVDGLYGPAQISSYDSTRCRIMLQKEILNASDFRELAHLANQIAEALEDG